MFTAGNTTRIADKLLNMANLSVADDFAALDYAVLLSQVAEEVAGLIGGRPIS